MLACRFSRRRLLGAGLAALGVASVGSRSALAQEVRYFRIGTGETGGSLFVLGGVIAAVVSNPPGSRACDEGGSCGVPGLIATAETTAGSVENVRSVAAGQMDSGLSQADVAYWAYTGKDIFAKGGSVASLRAIANLYQESVHVVVRRDSGLRQIGDLKGKRVGLGPKDSGNLVTARFVLRAYGLTEKRLHVDYGDLGSTAAKLEQGKLDAFIAVGATPLPPIDDLAQRVPLALLPITDGKIADLRRGYSFLSVDIIPADTYQGVAQTSTVGIGVIWLVAASLDENLVFQLTQALWNKANRRLLDETGSLGRQVLPGSALQAVPIPIHPGAQRFYAQMSQPPATDTTP
ncbi:MAG TPA: TAXI family TRAP transporter solute-binding subunit [Candidatus Bathyarchaeia archaeon]|nr:TAXI family TRAP transporter solute-binding subunit [Candidatus Bathyarchaeia archaeon]